MMKLPQDKERGKEQSHRGGRETIVVERERTKKLKELSGREGVTLFMMMLAAFQVLMYRESGEEDVIVGVPIAGRTQREMEGLIGFFVNTLAIRVRVKREESFRKLLEQVREKVLEAYAHQELPFEKLVEGLELERRIRVVLRRATAASRVRHAAIT